MLDYLVAVGVTLCALLGWIKVQQMARRFAARHPELGPAREEGTDCGRSCLCAGGHCRRERPQSDDRPEMPA